MSKNNQSEEEYTFNRSKIEEEYGLNNLDALMEEAEELLQEETDLTEDEIFASSAVASIRANHFPVLAREFSTRTGTDLNKVKEGVKVIAEDWEYDHISNESIKDFTYLFLNNRNRSEDMPKSVQKIVDEVIEEYDEIKEGLNEYNVKVASASVIFVAGHITHFEMDNFSFSELARDFDTDIYQIQECYREVWDKNDFRVKANVIDPSGVLQEVESIMSQLDINEQTKDNIFYLTINLDTEDNKYDNKATAAAIVKHIIDDSSKNHDINVEEKAQANSAAINRIQNKMF